MRAHALSIKTCKQQEWQASSITLYASGNGRLSNVFTLLPKATSAYTFPCGRTQPKRYDASSARWQRLHELHYFRGSDKILIFWVQYLLQMRDAFTVQLARFSTVRTRPELTRDNVEAINHISLLNVSPSSQQFNLAILKCMDCCDCHSCSCTTRFKENRCTAHLQIYCLALFY